MLAEHFGGFVMSAKFQPAVSRPKLKIAIAALFLLPLANASNATTVTSTFAVQITVASACVINSASMLNFGNAGVLVADVDNTSTLQVQCSTSTPYNIGLNAGAGSGATVAVRKMTSGSNAINYALYSDTGRTVVWGETIGTNTVGGGSAPASRKATPFTAACRRKRRRLPRPIPTRSPSPSPIDRLGDGGDPGRTTRACARRQNRVRNRRNPDLSPRRGACRLSKMRRR
jgi:spore coat protein U-like protein